MTSSGSIAAWAVLVCLLPGAPSVAEPQALLPGYTLTRVSDDVASFGISQMAFQPGDDTHLFTVQVTGDVVRYDYESTDGTLSSAVTVASGLGQSLGLAFHGRDLYVSMDLGGSLFVRPGDGRITRLSEPDEAGVYQTRHDFVHSIDKGAHDVNQIQIVGDTLYVGIGATGRIGDPDQETLYSMTIARIGDLRAIDFSGPIDEDFKGPVNWLADEAAWTDLMVADGRLRYYASGFRNPYGIAIDLDGNLWASTNGNSDAGFLSLDYLYKNIPPGGQGNFPPESFGFGPPHITGTPIAALADLGQNPSPTGFDFVPAGSDQGRVVLAQAGASDQVMFPVGKDVLLVDPDTGSFEILIDGMGLPTDVLRDPHGRLLISDLSDGSVWLLVPPPASSPAGRVPDGYTVAGQPLSLDKQGADLLLDWGASCAAGDDDYAIYEGQIGHYYSHTSLICSTGGATRTGFEPTDGDRYYLVVPSNGLFEGSAGHRTSGGLRPVGAQACLPRGISETCP